MGHGSPAVGASLMIPAAPGIAYDTGVLVAVYHLRDHDRIRARRIRIEGSRAIVGSQPGCDILVEDDADVAPRHVQLSQDGEDLVVEPLDGAYVEIEGTAIGQTTRTRTGAPIRVGETILKVSSTTNPTGPFVRVAPPDGFPGEPAPPTPPRRPAANPPPIARPIPTPLPPKRFRDTLSPDAREHELLVQLRARPAERDTRMVYGDWLETAGRPHLAAYVRGEGRDRDLLLRDSDPAWRAITSCNAFVGCTARFCPGTWDRLAIVPDDEAVRTCPLCDHAVRFCAGTEDIAGARMRGEHHVPDDSLDRG